jgi:DNA-binding NtrC family response regulator
MGMKNASFLHKVPCRILVLDLDESVLIALEQVLEEAGFETTTTWSTDEAFLWLQRKHFDLIVIGDHPPEIDAHATLRRLQASHRLASCIVMRAARALPNDPKLIGLVTSVPGCIGAAILEQVRQHVPALRNMPLY